MFTRRVEGSVNSVIKKKLFLLSLSLNPRRAEDPMHQALQMSRITGLPDPMQKTALAALSGSIDHLHRAVTGMDQLSHAQAILLLPVFYHNLKKLAIPTVDELDHPDEAASNSPLRYTLPMVFAAIRGIIKLGIGRTVPIPTTACQELWPRMSDWLRFLLTFHDNLRWLDGPSDDVLCVDLPLFVGSFKHDKPTARLFAATPGFCFMMGRAWLYLLKNDKFHVDTYFHIRHFLTEYLDVGNRANLDEFVDGAAGSFNQLASLVIGQIDRILSTQNGTLSRDNVVGLRFCLSIVVHIAIKTETQFRGVAVMGPLTAALVPHGGARTLAALAVALARSTFTDPHVGAHFVFEKCVMILQQIIASPGGHKQLSDALESGLLAALVSAAKSPFGDKVYAQSSTLLNYLLRPYTVYYTVLSKMDLAFLDAAAEERGPEFASSKTFFEWTTLQEATQERLEALELFCTRETEYKACDNDERAKSTIGATAGTPNIVVFRISHALLGARDRSFLRALLHYDYCEHRAYRVHIPELKFMHSRPDTPYFVLFDYSLVFPEISIKPIEDADGLELGPHWIQDVARAERSHGRIQLHVMRVGQAPTIHWLIPLRARTSRVHDELRRMAMELPADQTTWDIDSILKRIYALVEDVEPGSEIH
ncbi:hypothetical protein B0H19DRAFT_1064260 [Mycena capillaripes]|nr:hypothetical protein B0H19DRAFT_1064260 [Mycena capillaripes]